MKICTFDGGRVGVVHDEAVFDVTDIFFPDGLNVPWPYPRGDVVVERLPQLRDRLAERVESGAERKPLEAVKLGPSVATPGKIIGAPINYQPHIDEANADKEINHGKTYTRIDDFGLFLKANSSLAGCDTPIDIGFTDRRVDHEIELCAVIGKQGRAISYDDALDHIAGYTIGLDMTVRGKEFPDFRKSPDTFAVLGPYLVTADEIADPNALDFELTVNGEVRQKSNTRDLVFNVQQLVEYASHMYTLYPGDVIMTGTPAGVAPVKSGDRLVATIEGLGTLATAVK